MKVKVGNVVYDGNDQPVMVILSDQDKRNIKNMLPEATMYTGYPADYDPDLIMQWMEEEIKT